MKDCKFSIKKNKQTNKKKQNKNNNNNNNIKMVQSYHLVQIGNRDLSLNGYFMFKKFSAPKQNWQK